MGEFTLSFLLSLIKVSLIFFIYNINIQIAWKAILSLRPNQGPVRPMCAFLFLIRSASQLLGRFI
jgi:hypothetical protein